MTWKGHFSLLVVLLSPYLIAGSPTPPSSDFSNRGLHIETSSGQVHGFINETAPSVRQFLGVPFAEPPLGELRFEPPLPIKRRSKPIDATTWAASCIQQLSTSASVFTEVVQQFLINGGQSEDCLYLNIWAPLPENIPKGEKLPVFFYVPGGGFTGGGADSMYKVPDKWIQRTQTHIVVVLKYVSLSRSMKQLADTMSSKLSFECFRFPECPWLESSECRSPGSKSCVSVGFPHYIKST